MKEGLLKISDQEWDEAVIFFKNNKNTKKEKKKGSPSEHSFIKIPGRNPDEYEIFAMASKSYIGESGKKEEKEHAALGEGTFGKVKVVQNRKGENFAVKIEGRGLRGEKDVETQITKMLGFTLGEAERTFTNNLGQTIKKVFKGKETSKKLYTVMQLREGKELKKYIYLPSYDSNQLSSTQKLIVALKTCNVVYGLHNKGIIHADLKPANLMANIDGQQIVVSSIDFGLSMILEPGKNKVMAKKKGSPFYMAPELLKPFEKWTNSNSPPVSFSFASDIYALGVMFKEDLHLPKKIWDGMLKKSPQERDNMFMAMSKIVEKLDTVAKNDPNALEPDTKKYILEIKSQLNEKRDKVLNNLFEEYKDGSAIQQLYNSYLHTGTLGNWMISKAKAASHHFKGSSRAEKITTLALAFEGLFENKKNLTTDERAKVAIAHLYLLRKDIQDEKNTFSSSLEKLCNKLITDISLTVGQEKVEAWINTLDSANKPQQTPSRSFKF